MNANEKLIVALDVPTFDQAIDKVKELSSTVKIFKVGSQLYTACGPKIIEKIHEAGAKVFLDLKFYDIPNTVAKVSEVVTELGVFMFNVHAAGGEQMMVAAREAADQKAAQLGIKRPIMIAVTVLTSFSQDSFHHTLNFDREIAEHVKHSALMAQNSGLDGVVASTHEIKLIRQTCGDRFVIVTPGIRPAQADVQDQKRIMTPEQAIKEGSDYLVVGRPILAAPEPEIAARLVLEKMS